MNSLDYKKQVTEIIWTFCLIATLIFFIPSISFADESISGLVFRNIKIVVRDVFDKGDEGLLYKTANAVKLNTKEDIVKRELLFKEGDPYNKFVVAESGRNLRTLPFLRNISITESREGNFVDVVVSVQDTWTLFPIITMASGSGANKKTLGIIEGNLAGYGKRLEGSIADDEGRQTNEIVWDDRRFLGTLQRFSAGHFDRSDGQSSIISWGLPFRSLVNKQAWFIDAENSDLIGRMFRDGSERYIYRQKHSSIMGGYTFAAGEPSKLLNRLTFGYSFQRDQFSEATAKDFNDIGLLPSDVPVNGGELANDREFSGPVVSWQMIQPEFISLNYIDAFDRVQDFNLGNELVSNIQISPEILGSQKDSLIFRLTDTNGYKISPQQFFRGQISASSRLERDTYRETIFSAQARYYKVFGPQYAGDIFLGQHTIATSANLDSGYNLDNDTEFLLGATNGLRGYKDRTLSGKHRVNFNLEDRVHLAEEIAKLVNLGAAVFADVGSVSNENIHEALTQNFYANVGVGLRLGLARSSGGTVVRIDLAFPLRDGPDGSLKMEPRLLFTTGQLFSGFLRSDAPGLSTPSISAGFVR